jgi:hypothetical protein
MGAVQAKKSNVEAVLRALAERRDDAELDARDVEARRAALDAEAKAIATETSESYKFDFPGKGSVSISGRKEKEYLGQRPVVGIEAFQRATERQREGLLAKGIIKLEDHWAAAFYGRVTVKLHAGA